MKHYNSGNREVLEKEKNLSILASTFTAIMNVFVCVYIYVWDRYDNFINHTISLKSNDGFFYNNKHELM